MVEARVYGAIWAAGCIFTWVYYTLWILITPSIDGDHFI